MNNFTLAQKQALEALVEGGAQVFEVAYDPLTVSEIPAPPAGCTVFYSESNANLVEIIYTK